VFFPVLVAAPLSAVLATRSTPAIYRSSADVAFTGRNTGSLAGDAIQAQEAIGRERILAQRTLVRVQVPRLSVSQLQRETLRDTHVEGGRLRLTVEDSDPHDVRGLVDVYAHVLARDQLARVASPVSPAEMLAPRPLRNGIAGLLAGFVLASFLTLFLQAAAPRRRKDR